MIRRLICAALVAAATAGALPSEAGAGQYTVAACFSGINNSWQPNRSNGSADAFVECPGGVSIGGRLTQGMGARNTGGGSSAPAYSSAKLVFDAPPGARIVRLAGEINQSSTGGWQAGIRDEAGGRWLWCGTGCVSTFGLWTPFDIGGLSTSRVSALVICGQSACSRSALYGLAALRNVNVVIADDTPPNVTIAGGSLAAGGWRRGWQNVVVAASDAVGVRSTTVLVDGRTQGSTDRVCDGTRAIPCPNGVDFSGVQTSELPDGQHTLTAVAVDSAGNRSQVTRRVALDNTPPPRPLALSIDGGSGWRPSNSFRMRWTNTREAAVAPVTAASIELCPIAPAAPPTRCLTTTRTGAGITSAAGVRVPSPGQWRARVSLQDAGGNRSTSSETVLRFDDQAPTLSFVAQSQDRPALVRVKAQDVGSGLGVREITLTRRGSSTSKSLSLIADRNGFSTTIDDEHLRDGIYDLRARARDLAGNERSTDQRTDGRRAALALPLRIKASLRVGKRMRVRARGANGKRRYRIVLVEKPRSRYGRTILLRGRLTSLGGNPLAGSYDRCAGSDTSGGRALATRRDPSDEQRRVASRSGRSGGRVEHFDSASAVTTRFVVAPPSCVWAFALPRRSLSTDAESSTVRASCSEDACAAGRCLHPASSSRSKRVLGVGG